VRGGEREREMGRGAGVRCRVEEGKRERERDGLRRGSRQHGVKDAGGGAIA
jgi:hypothetical protein